MKRSAIQDYRVALRAGLDSGMHRNDGRNPGFRYVLYGLLGYNGMSRAQRPIALRFHNCQARS
jgi:hypothetical protein